MTTIMETSNYWHEIPTQAATPDIDPVVDLVFAIRGRQIPADHAWPLSEAITQVLPWLEQQEQAGIHLIHGAQSSNGWQQPSDDGTIELSARTRFVLRIPSASVDAARVLTGQTLDILGYSIDLLQARVRALLPLTTVLARHVRGSDSSDTESAFLEDAVNWLSDLSITPRKMLCGRAHRLNAPQGAILTRSLLLAELTPGESATLQQQGLGQGRLMGFGLFMPYKSIDAVYEARPNIND
jgi:CRISPR-associated protein Cas6